MGLMPGGQKQAAGQPKKFKRKVIKPVIHTFTKIGPADLNLIKNKN